jgi:hypothetical protein
VKGLLQESVRKERLELMKLKKISPKLASRQAELNLTDKLLKNTEIFMFVYGLFNDTGNSSMASNNRIISE